MNKKIPSSIYIGIIVLQLIANVFLSMLLFSDSKLIEVASFESKDRSYSLQFMQIGETFLWGNDEVEVYVTDHCAEGSDKRRYFRMTLCNSLNWYTLSTLRFEEITGGVNFYVAQNSKDGETKYTVIWDNVFPSTNTQ